MLIKHPSKVGRTMKDKQLKYIQEILCLAENCGHIHARIIDAGYNRDRQLLEDYEQEGKEALAALKKKLALLGLGEAEQGIRDMMDMYLNFSKSHFSP